MSKDNKENYPRRKLQEHNGQYSLNIPKSVAQIKGWGKGTVVMLKLNEKGNLEIMNI